MSNPSQPQSPHPKLSLPQVRLIERENDVLATAESDAASDPFTPFALPRLPQDQIDRITPFHHWIWQSYRRCAATILLLNVQEQTWTSRIPAQRCGRDAASWNVCRDDFPGISEDHLFLAGSMQLRVLAEGEPASDAVPPHDGLHLVQVLGPNSHTLWSFLRCAGITRPIPAERILLDPWHISPTCAPDRTKFP